MEQNAQGFPWRLAWHWGSGATHDVLTPFLESAVQLPACAPGNAVGDDPRTWGPATRVGDPHRDCGPVLAFAAIWGARRWKILCVSSLSVILSFCLKENILKMIFH